MKEKDEMISFGMACVRGALEDLAKILTLGYDLPAHIAVLLVRAMAVAVAKDVPCATMAAIIVRFVADKTSI